MVVGIIASIVAGVVWLGSIMKLVGEYILKAIEKIWDVMIELVKMFQKVAPSWLNWLFFILLLTIVGGALISFLLSFKYACNNENQLREANSIYDGITLFWEMSIKDAGYNGTGECTSLGQTTGAELGACSDLTTQNACEMFNLTNLPDYTEGCVWDGDDCSGFLWDFGICSNGLCCPHFNSTYCTTWTGCAFKNYSVDSEYINAKTSPSKNVTANTMEDMVRINCLDRTPKVTFFGMDIFNYRIWVMIMLITLLFKLRAYVKK